MAKKEKNIFRKLFQKHTLIILNEESHEEQFAFRLNRMNVLVIVALMSFFIIGCTTLTLLYTPLRDYFVPSQKQLEVSDRQEIIKLMDQLEEMENRVKANDIYINNIKAILAGDIPIPEFTIENEQITTSIDLSKMELAPSKEDLKLREEVEKEEMFNIQTNQIGQESGNLLFTPLKGMITATYDLQENHLAIDIAAQQGEAIKSVAGGTVVFTDWTPDTGYVIVIQHSMGMLSVYKHALTVYKKVGEIIKKGEVIAAVGNTGELTTGPHLHFELWIDGNPVDPQQYIVF
ncbi:MAG: M23 family metallopeptidase [Weeksellaceae bacterium]|jgi:murein DD-endopeptidase MepM/ murein hydrolase activator NlpD|nr:M23 family metallopeptidase [Weeksellaceae bacterium]MDX9704333.1 M23 family metallopeptidase [Weeksellaceae bacterium]